MDKQPIKFKRLPAESLTGIRVLPPTEGERRKPENSDTGMFVDLAGQNLDIVVEITFKVPGKPGPYIAQGHLEWMNAGAAVDQPKGLGIRLVRVFADPGVPANVSAPELSSMLRAVPGGAAPNAAQGVAGTPGAPAGHAGTSGASAATPASPAAAPAAPPAPAKVPDVPLPEAKVVSELLAGLLGSDVPVTVCESAPFVHPEMSMIGVMEDDTGKVLALWHCDLPFVLNVGGALTMVPQEEVQLALKSRKVPGNLLDNWKEIVNVGASLFNNGPKHLRLRGMHAASDPVPDEWKELFQKPAARVDMTCDISGYGQGRMAVLVA